MPSAVQRLQEVKAAVPFTQLGDKYEVEHMHLNSRLQSTGNNQEQH
jgi:hypothetical protein